MNRAEYIIEINKMLEDAPIDIVHLIFTLLRKLKKLKGGKHEDY